MAVTLTSAAVSVLAGATSVVSTSALTTLRMLPTANEPAPANFSVETDTPAAMPRMAVFESADTEISPPMAVSWLS